MSSDNKTIKKSTKTKKSKVNKDNSVGLSDVVARREFYKESRSSLFKIVGGSLIALVGSVCVAFYSTQIKENNVYFAVSQDGSMIELSPLSDPNQNDKVVSAWLADALIDTFEFTYRNYKDKINKAANKWFTGEGGNELIRAMGKAKMIDTVVDNAFLVDLTLEHNPLLVKKTNSSSAIFGWMFQVPAKITYRNETQVYSLDVLFTVTVSRRSLLDDSKGLGIARIVLEENTKK